MLVKKFLFIYPFSFFFPVTHLLIFQALVADEYCSYKLLLKNQIIFALP